MKFETIILFLSISLMSSLACKNTTTYMIKEIGYKPLGTPKGYAIPSKWIRRLFKIKEYRIPLYLYFELYLSLFFASLGPINILIWGISNFSTIIAGYLAMFHICLVIVDTIILSIMSIILKRK